MSFFDSDTGISSPPYNANTELTVASTKTLRKDGQIMFYGGAQVVTASGWGPSADGTTRLAASLSTKIFYIPVNGLKSGDEIVGFRITGQIESGGNAVTLDADFRKVTGAAADVTDASVGAITQISKTADYAVNDAKTFTAIETVATNNGYYVVITGTTNASTDIAVIGIEVTVNRK